MFPPPPPALIPSNPPLKVDVLSSPSPLPIFEYLVGDSTPAAKEGGRGVYTMNTKKEFN